jgi:uncharacterized membrane protein HdeD (DUF308 family)/predicted flap endonuclease-1-like 5' DNA nuclease
MSTVTMSRRDARKVLVPWWLILIEGVALIILGILFLTNPAATAVVVVTVLGLYWLISGILGIIGIFLNHHNWFWKLLLGLLGIAAGILILQHPISSTFVVGASLTLWLGILGIVMGVMNIIRGIMGEGWGVLVLGVVSIIIGAVLLANFWGVTISLPWTLGIVSIVGGLIAILDSFRARRLQNEIEAERERLIAAGMTAEKARLAAAANVTGVTAAAATAAAGAAAATRAVDSPVDAGEVVGAETAAAIEPDKIGVDSLRDYVSGLSPAEIEKLKAAEVTTAGSLLDAGATPAGRAALAAKTGIEPDRLLEYLNTLDLQRIKGVGVAYSWLLKRTGVDTVRELATRNPGNLTRALASTNATMGLVERLPVESEVADWVAQAKTLPPKLTY